MAARQNLASALMPSVKIIHLGLWWLPGALASPQVELFSKKQMSNEAWPLSDAAHTRAGTLLKYCT